MKGCIVFGAWVSVALWLCGLGPSELRWWVTTVVTDTLFVVCAAKAPNDPKLSDSGPGARMGARRREAKARAVPGFMAGSTARD